jgi:hypothetical protein
MCVGVWSAARAPLSPLLHLHLLLPGHALGFCGEARGLPCLECRMQRRMQGLFLLVSFLVALSLLPHTQACTTGTLAFSRHACLRQV